MIGRGRNMVPAKALAGGVFLDLPFPDEAKIVELGGGERPAFHPNVDARAKPSVDVVADLDKALPFPDRSFDGVYCVPGDTIVAGCCEAISKIGAGTKVVSSNGMEQEVRMVFKRPYVGEMVRIKVACLLPVELTPEHPVLVAQVKRKDVRSLKRHGIVAGNYIYEYEQPEWKPAGSVKAGDWVIAPRLEGWNRKYVWVNNTVPKTHGWRLNETTAWFLGMYVAEGSQSHFKKSGATFANFTLGLDEENLAEGLLAAGKSLGLKGRIFVRERSLVARFRGRGTVKLEALCGHGAENKQVPTCIKDAKLKVVRSFIHGLVDGDGAMSGYEHHLFTCSRRLTVGVQELLFKIGVSAHISVQEPRMSRFQGRIIRQRFPQYCLSWSTRAWEGKRDKQRRLPYGQARFTPRQVFLPVKEVERFQWAGDVYNLSTHDETFGVPFLVHNCSYTLEHVSWRRVSAFIKEMARILKEDGVAVVVTANTYEQVKQWAVLDPALWNEKVSQNLFGDQDYQGKDWVWNAHHVAMSPEYAVRLFKEAGFQQVTIQDHPATRTDMIITARKQALLSPVAPVRERLCLGSFMDLLPPPWWNLDILPLNPHIPLGFRFRAHDLTKGIPFADGSTSLIYTSHMLEHVTLDEAKAILWECHRVLAPGGVLRVSVPDGYLIARMYAEGGMDFFNQEQPPEYIQAPTQGEKFSRLMFAGHRQCFDEASLTLYMREAGFKDVARALPGKSRSLEIQAAVGMDKHAVLSLIVEGTKPL